MNKWVNNHPTYRKARMFTREEPKVPTTILAYKWI